jgi:hypothetical protein
MKVVLYLIGVGIIGSVLNVAPAQAGEFAVLGSGFRIHADRHETDGATVRLYEGTGVSEFPAASIVSFEDAFEAPKPVVPPVTLALVTPAHATASTPKEIAAEAALTFALPAAFVQSVMRAESAFRQSALSPKGAIGLMQLMPETARQLGVNPKDAWQNAQGGAHYLHDLLALYENRPDQVLLALAAYNAGPAAVEKYHGVPPYRETREYIARIVKAWQQASGNDRGNDSGNK